MPHFLGYISYPLAFEKTDGESSQACHVFRTVTFWDSTAIFIVIPVKDVVTAVFNTPVLAIVSQDLFGCGQLRRLAGNSLGYHLGFFASFSVTGYTFNFEDLSDMREV